MLLDKYMPRYDVRTRHSARVHASPARTYAALRAINLERSGLIRLLFTLRGLPARFAKRKRTAPSRSRPLSFLESALSQGWVLLEELQDSELVMGSVTQPWKPVVEFCGVPPSDFLSFAEPGFAKIAWNFAVAPAPDGSLVSLETRVLTTDPDARRRFHRYWIAFSPFIKLIRRLIIGVLRRDLREAGRARTI